MTGLYLPEPRHAGLHSAAKLTEFGTEALHLLGSAGRGPTRLIVPPRTLKSWGSSSRLERRSNHPSRGARGSWVNWKRGPWRSLAPHWLSRCSASRTIVRNLYILKGTPSWPTRHCRKKSVRHENGHGSHCEDRQNDEEQQQGQHHVHPALGGAWTGPGPPDLLGFGSRPIVSPRSAARACRPEFGGSPLLPDACERLTRTFTARALVRVGNVGATQSTTFVGELS